MSKVILFLLLLVFLLLVFLLLVFWCQIEYHSPMEFVTEAKFNLTNNVRMRQIQAFFMFIYKLNEINELNIWVD